MKKGVQQTIVLILAALFHISVDGCPTNCTCLPDNQVNCQHGHLENIPTDIPSGTTYLQLQYNRIRSLEPNAFQPSLLRTLQKLELSHNELGFVHPDAFSSRRSNILEVLDLSNNNLSTINPYTFDKLEKLQYLNLQRNKLPHINVDMFTGLQSLTNLNLQNNMISVIQPASMQHLPSLVNLTLQNNRLMNLRDRTFEGLTNLQTLDLSRNRISRVDSNAFVGLNNMSDLRLDFNRLPAIPELPELQNNWFPRNSLQRLNLSHNPIQTITDHALGLAIELRELYLHNLPVLSSVQNFAFRGLPKLQRLYMYNNPGLNILPVNALSGLPRLQLIDLHNNSIKALNFSMYPKFFELHAVDLSDNPWDCSCENANFRKYVVHFSSHGRVLNSGRTLCKYPPQLEGEAFLSVSDRDCSNWYNDEDEEEEYEDEEGEGEEDEEDERQKSSEEKSSEEESREDRDRRQALPQPEQYGQYPNGPEVPCTHNVCLENGVCKLQGDSASCRCPRNYGGNYCETYGYKGMLQDIWPEPHSTTSIDVSWTMKQQSDDKTSFLVHWSVNGPMQFVASEDLPRTATWYRIEGLQPRSFHIVCVHSYRYNFPISYKCKQVGTLGYDPNGVDPWDGESVWPDNGMNKPVPQSSKTRNIGKAIGIAVGVVAFIAIVLGVTCRIRYIRRRANAEPEAPPEYSRDTPRDSQIQLQDLPPPYHEVVSQGIANPGLQAAGIGLQNRDNRSSNNTLKSASSLPTISEENEGGIDVEQQR